MPRAHRHYLPGHVWHITHRCHQSDFLLQFVRDRDRYRYWLYQARKRYGLCVLNYMITCNHVHLLVRDTAPEAVARGMQLIAGRTAQEYNDRRKRKGAFWEDRYHATAVQTDSHLRRCFTYIDLNMVRAGVVTHPDQWRHCGYQEVRHPRQRASGIDHGALLDLFGFAHIDQLQREYQQWIDEAMRSGRRCREPYWSTALAVGQRDFIARVRADLLTRAGHRCSDPVDFETKVLREPGTAPYNPQTAGENGPLSTENGYYWRDILFESEV